MASRKPIPPPIKCDARSKRTGEKCGRWATPGLYPPRCYYHGGAPGTGAPPPHDAAGKAEAGRYLATLVDRLNGERRPVWAVIADAVHHADALMCEARAQIEAGNLSPDALERLESATRLAHGLASAAVTAKAAELQGQAAAVWSDAMASRVYVLLDSWLGLPAGSQAVAAGLEGVLSAVDIEGEAPRPPAGWRTWTDQVAGELADVLAPRLDLPTEAVRRWLKAAIAAAGWRPLPDLPGAALALPAAEPAAPEPAPEPEPPPVPEPAAPEAESEPEPIRPAEPDHLSEEIEHLERHHTAARTAQAAKLRRVRDRRITTTLGAGPARTGQLGNYPDTDLLYGG